MSGVQKDIAKKRKKCYYEEKIVKTHTRNTHKKYMNYFDTPSVEQMKRLLERARAGGAGSRACERLEWLLYFVEHGKSVSETCAHFGIARSTFHRWMDRFDPNDLSSLEEKSHEPMTLRQPTVPREVVELVRRYRMRYPQMGKERLRQVLQNDHSITLSVSSVGRIIERECLYFGDTPLHWKKRMQHGPEQGMSAAEQVPMPTAPMPAPVTLPPLQPQPAAVTDQPPMPTVAMPDDHTGAAHCLLCAWKAHGKKSLKRAALIASLLVNAALIGVMLMTAAWEGRQSAERHAAAGTPQTEYTDTQINLD